MSANTTQVGGDHYSAEFQHWDWVVMLRLGYLEGCCSKYVARYKKKGGEQDLYKAAHYLMKIREMHGEGLYDNDSLMTEHKMREECRAFTAEFCRQANLDRAQSDFMYTIATWRDSGDLVVADMLLGSIMEQNRLSLRRPQAPAGAPAAGAGGTPPAAPGAASAGGPSGAAQGQRGAALATGGAAGSGYGQFKSADYQRAADLRETGMEHPFGYDAAEES